MWKKGAKRWERGNRASTACVEKKMACPQSGGRGPNYPQGVFHICTKAGGNYSYRALMLALMSLMTSATSGLCLTSFSTRSMECITVV